MTQLLALFKTYRFYYLPAFLLIVVGLLVQLYVPKGAAVLYLNDMHTASVDTLFMGITKLGELLGGVLILLVLLVTKKKRSMLIFGVAIVLSTFASQGLKHLVFDTEDRPSVEFTNLEPIDGLERHKNNSFPSGHTTAAFTFFTVLGLSYSSKWVHSAMPVCASIVGISRVYLGQHYLSDIVTGAVLGLLLTSCVFIWFDRKYPSK